MLIDSHVNLHGEKYEEDLSEVLDRAVERGVDGMLVISDRLESLPEISQIASSRPYLWQSVGVHPHYAKDFQDLTAKQLIDIAVKYDAVGIGECGLDLYYEYSEIKLQEPVFRAHVDACRETGLPLIIHSRDADDLMSTILKERCDNGQFIPLMHCYTSGLELAKTALDLGGYISFSGIITFKNAHDVREILSYIPMDRLLIETDCPYLAPVPHRGRRCEPAHVYEVAEKVAEEKKISLEEVAAITSDNFFKVFQKADRTKAIQR